ncbi:MAG: PhnB protein [Solirubrobacteraceae bacterium]|jgi:PhnB protein|nr:PhnB protein [Solirubrobacteraceae bacterium]
MPSQARVSVPPIPEHLSTVTPRLIVRDARAAIDFYRAAFAAQPLDEPFTDPEGKVIHAEIRIGSSVVMITDAGVDEALDASPAAGDRPVTAIMATYWEDVDAAWHRALAAGAEIVYPLADHFYGERGGRLRDPFGQQWMLSQRIEHVSQREMNSRAAQYFESA